MRNDFVLGSSLVVGLGLLACSGGAPANGSIGPSTSTFGPAPQHGTTIRGWMSRTGKKRLLYVSLTQASLVDVYSIPNYTLVGQIPMG